MGDNGFMMNGAVPWACININNMTATQRHVYHPSDSKFPACRKGGHFTSSPTWDELKNQPPLGMVTMCVCTVHPAWSFRKQFKRT